MECLANYISNTLYLLALIPRCSNTSTETEFVESAVVYLRTQQINFKPDELFSDFASFISKASVSYPSIAAAFIQFRENRNDK
jgi:hypothetical protein